MTDAKATPPPATSYRALCMARDNGFEVDAVKLAIWQQEESVLRSAMAFPSSYRSCVLKPAHFEAPMHGLAWHAFLNLVERTKPGSEEADQPIDPVVLLAEMRRLNEEIAGDSRGYEWIIKAVNEEAVPPAYGLVVVRRLYKLQRLRSNKKRFGKIFDGVGKDTDIDTLEAELVTVSRDLAYEVEGETHIDGPFIKSFEWDEYDPTTTSVVETGLTEVDRCAGGGNGRGEMLVVGAGTNVGKSYLAARVLRRQGELKNRALHISCEDPTELMFCRMVADYSDPRITPVEVRRKKADPEVVQRARAKMAEDFGDRIYIVEHKKPTVNQVCEMIRAHRYRCDIDIVIIDYLQAIREDDERMASNRVLETGSIISKLKRCFTETKVAGVVMSQLSREAYKDGTEPTITSCKYCGDIENESEIMLLMWRDAEERIHAKLPKVKWMRARDLRFIIPVDEVTGGHLAWQEDFAEPPANDEKKKKKGRDE